MKPLTKHITSLMAFLMLLSLAGISWAEGGIKARMKSRLPEIKALKTRGIIGENHLGYLEFVGSAKEQADMVAAENTDRKKVYTAIAQKNKTTVENVGVRRALKIAEKTMPGYWLKNAEGQWIKKK